MNDLFSMILSGLSRGMLVGLIALGYVLTYRATSVVNFTVGSVMLLGVYVATQLQADLGFVPAVAVALAVAACVSVGLDALLRRSDVQDHDLLSVATIGINTAISADLLRRIGSQVLPVGDPWGDDLISLGGATIPATRAAGLLMAVSVLGALAALLRWTSLGLAMRAAATEREGAALVGVRLGRVALISWALGGASAVLGGIMLCTFPSAGLNVSTGDLALVAFAAAILGGLDSLAGAVIGAGVIGLAHELVTGYSDHLSFLGSGATTALPFLLMFIILLVRPAGLLGTRRLERV
jgi:branched-chain amino acid transport system permease protein